MPTPQEQPLLSRHPSPSAHGAVSLPAADRLRWRFPEDLPISSMVDEIKSLWHDHPVIIVGGDTGSGKTTQLPKIALELGSGRRARIGCTQPRRIAAVTMARRVADELGVRCGGEVGYQIRFEDCTCRDTVLKFMTDGILLTETRRDRLLRQYDTIIIDEAHERSLNIDFILGYLKLLLDKRDDLKVAISSATLDLDGFSRFFNGAPVVNVTGRTFPVEDYFMPPETEDEDLTDQVTRAVDFLTELDAGGSILVFLPGERDIHDCLDHLAGHRLPRTEILPLYSRMAAADQQKIFLPCRMRRIILATNVAETSVTIPGIRFCIDSGLARVSRYNPRTMIQELHIESVSKASARQRRGRCGRTADGICVHLYSADDLDRSDEYTDPEIKRTSLAGVILQMASLHLPHVDSFPFLNPPPPPLVRDGMRTLADIRAMLPGGQLTAIGRRLAGLPLDPRLGRMLLEAARNMVLDEVMVIAAYLSLPDPRERPADRQSAADAAHMRFSDEKSDFVAILRLWEWLQCELGGSPSRGAVRRLCKNSFLNCRRINEWRNLVADLAACCDENGLAPAMRRGDSSVARTLNYDAVHRSLLAGVPRQIAHYVQEQRCYLGTGGRKFTIFPGSYLYRRRKPPEWLMSFALVETRQLYARMNAEIKPEYVEQVAPHLCVSIFDSPRWDSVSGFVYAREKLMSGGLILQSGRRVDYARKNRQDARSVFIRSALTPGRLNLGSWVTRHAEMVRNLEYWESKLRRPGTVADYEAIYAHFDAVLPADITSTLTLKKFVEENPGLDLGMSIADAMQEQTQELSEADYPDFLTFAGVRFELRYVFTPGETDDGITVMVPDGAMALLPDWLSDWLVPGVLPAKIELMFRALPKDLRRELSPIGERVDEFLETVRSGAVFREQPLADALSDFLKSAYGRAVAPQMFAPAHLPEYLTMKFAELDAGGQVRRILRSLPKCQSIGSRVVGQIPGYGEELARSGLKSWPADLVLPQTIPLPGTSGRSIYPALTDEGGSVGVQCFLRPGDAATHHRQGMVRFFRLGHPEQVDYIRRRTLTLPREMQLSWFAADRNCSYIDEWLDAAILRCLGVEHGRIIRDAMSYAEAESGGADELMGVVAAQKSCLQTLYGAYESLKALCGRLRDRQGADCRDLQRQLSFLFAPGFLRRPAVWDEYGRYLQSARLRAERMMHHPAKDAEKLKSLSPWLEKFHLAVATISDVTDAPELYRFWLLLEEARIQCFSPEIKLREKSPLSRLADAWETIRF